jgi:hypothetical protein
MRYLAAILAWCAAPVVLVAQVPSPTSRTTLPTVTVTAGVGNAMGWIGAQAERYFSQGRFSAFGGLGYTRAVYTYDPSGVTVAAGARGYTAGLKHRGFLELSVCQIATRSDPVDPKRFYGPGLELGYQFASRGGFTFALSAGVGYALGTSEGESSAGPLLGLGLGYTWRRRA